MTFRPPGPKGVPVFGNSGRFSADPFSFMTACAEAYGDVVSFDLGPIPLYMLTNPRDIQRVLVDDSDRFPKLDLGDDAIHTLLGDGLLMSEGETWQTQRQLANPSFHGRRIRTLGEMMVDHTESMLADWEPGDRIDIHVEMARLTVRIIVNAMFGTDIADERIRTIQTNLDPLGARFEPDPFGRLIPNWAPTTKNREFRRAVDSLETVIGDLVADRRREGYGGEQVAAGGDAGAGGSARTADDDADDPPMDLLSVLLRAHDRGAQTDQQIRDEMMTMLLAGHDTTALSLTYAWYLLSEHPAAERRLHAELDTALGGDPPTASPTRQLDYTEQVITESMRLYPPVYTLFREAAADVSIAGYRVPAGSGLMLPQWVVHRSPRWYDAPETFDPDRWQPDRATDRHRFAFFPFGGGPRHCIGKQFSMLEAQLILATVAQQYELDYLGDGFDLRGSLTMHPSEPVAMAVRER